MLPDFVPEDFFVDVEDFVPELFVPDDFELDVFGFVVAMLFFGGSVVTFLKVR